MSTWLDQLKSSSAYSGGNAVFIETLYEEYLKDPGRVPQDWRARFDQLPGNAPDDKPHEPVKQRFLRLAREKHGVHPTPQPCLSPDASEQQIAVLQLINGYRFRGHQKAKLDPLKLRESPYVPDLDLAYHNLDQVDPATEFNTGSLVAPSRLPLGEIIERLEKTYCGSIGSEYLHITDTVQKRWIQGRLELVLQPQHEQPP